MRSRVVFPAPFGPRRATNSPGETAREIPRRATREPKRLSMRSKRMPKVAAAPDAGKATRSASNQIAQDFFHALAFAGVVAFGDGAGLAAQLEAEEIVFQFVETPANLAIHFRNRGGR